MALRRNILLFHAGALGDFVLTWPLALTLARIYPQSRVFYVTPAGKGRLAEKALGIEWADAEAGWHPLFGSGRPLAETPRRLLAGAHSVVSFLSSPDGPFVANVKAVAPEANVLTIDPMPPDSFSGHATNFQLEQLRPWPAARTAAGQIHRSVQSRGVPVARATAPAGVVIHPGSGSPVKNWPVERFIELAERLRATDDDVRFVIGEVEHERWPKDLVSTLERVARVVRPTDLIDLMNEINSARAFVGNDSGPGHLAAILGVPTLALFGPTDPARWKPLGPRVKTLRVQPIDAIEVDAAEAEVRKLLDAGRATKPPPAGDDDGE